MARRINPDRAEIEMLEQYKKLQKLVLDRTQKVLMTAGNQVLKASIPLTPLDTGALRRSGKVNVEPRAQIPVCQVTFGGTTAYPTKNAPAGVVDYAITVHEDLGTPHAVGGPKYLTYGGRAALPKVKKTIQDGYRRITNKGSL